VLTAANGLKILLGIDPKQEVEARDNLDIQPVDPALLTGAEEGVLEQNATLRALKLQTEVNDAIVSVYRSESLPTLAAFGNYLWQSQNNALNFSANNARSAQVGLNVSWNLFNGLQTRARVNQAEVDYLKSEEQLTSAKYAMQTNIQSIRLRLESAKKRIDAQGLNVEQAEKGYKIAVTRFQTGSGTQLEVNDADLALLRARVNKAQAMYDYLVARADLEETMSVLTP
jgi:outer membrane protein TolC